jgi:uncharacterized membrane protein
VFKEYFHQITTYLLETLGANFIFLTILLTTAAAILYFMVISYLITQLDTGYFLRKKTSAEQADETSHLSSTNSSLSYVFKIVKIILGVILLVCGLLMLVLPGQGLLTMLIGLSLLPFPGKQKMEQNILSRKSIRQSLNWIRIKANKEPFIFD